MRLFIAVCIALCTALGAQAQPKSRTENTVHKNPESTEEGHQALPSTFERRPRTPDCTDPFSFEQETLIDLDQHSPTSVAPGALKGVYAYAGDVVKPAGGHTASRFDLLVFDTHTHPQKWPVSQKTMPERAVIQEAKKVGLEPWAASVKEPNDKVGFFAYGEPFYLEVVPEDKQKATNDPGKPKAIWSFDPATPGWKPQLKICRRP
jgi:hypothetical protein